ncbi:MAG: hypothetical protein L3J76_04810, partial [Candidatus Hydrothermae bacterium]|nr:hypothetical protein [Candidatus Hydrothermae bacterium]
ASTDWLEAELHAEEEMFALLVLAPFLGIPLAPPPTLSLELLLAVPDAWTRWMHRERMFDRWETLLTHMHPNP